MEFLDVRAFWAMVGLPLVVGAMLWGLHGRQAFLKEFGRMDLLAQFSRLSLGGRGAHQVLPTAFCFGLLVISLARPILSGASREILKGALDVVAVLDVSKSMRAEDCGPAGSRFEIAKTTLLQCLPDLAGNRLGLVTFAGKSFPQAELTDDIEALKFVLQNWVNVDSAPFQGSNIEMALSEAVRLFGEEKRKRVILFISDGGHVRPENLDGILADMGAKGITVVSVGIGTKEGAKIPVYVEGRFSEWLRIEGNEVETRLNEGILQEISRKTGGKYILLRSARDLKGILRDPAVVGTKALTGGKEIFQIPLGFAIGAAFLAIYLKRRGTSETVS
jgi:Ca-activated chloride channel family protein